MRKLRHRDVSKTWLVRDRPRIEIQNASTLGQYIVLSLANISSMLNSLPQDFHTYYSFISLLPTLLLDNLGFELRCYCLREAFPELPTPPPSV